MSYNNWHPSSTSPKPLPANNPFLETSAANRFPAIDLSAGSSAPSSSSFVPSYQAPPQNSSYGQPLIQSSFQFQQYGNHPASYNTSPAPQQQWSGVSSIAYNPTGAGGLYAQPLQHAGLSQVYGQPQSYAFQQQPQYAGYHQFSQQQQQQQQQQQYQRNLVSEFDPHGPLANTISNGFTVSQTASPTSPIAGQQQSFASGRTGPSGQQHPRDYVQSHKSQLETWNTAAWRQILSIFEDLKRAWETQRIELRRHLLAGQYLTQEDVNVINTMIRTAESNIDSVTAALLQMQEVNSSYKLSSDAASKTRVREALNAGLVNLPDWP